MLRSLLGALLGLLFGATLAGVVACFMSGMDMSSSGWTTYPTISEAILPPPEGAHMRRDFTSVEYSLLPLRHALFLAFLVGGGFGAVAGAVVGATSAIVAAMREHRQESFTQRHQEKAGAQ
jgi:hypothetical protein